MRSVVIFLLALVTGTSAFAGKIGDVRTTGNSISRQSKGKPLWTLNHDPEEEKPYIHPTLPEPVASIGRPGSAR